jgi:hypothetical protein
MLKTGFLVIVGGIVLHQSAWMIAAVLAGYIALGFVDRYLLQKARDGRFEHEFTGWVQDSSDRDSETKGGLTRVRLDPPHAIVVYRIAELLRGGVR